MKNFIVGLMAILSAACGNMTDGGVFEALDTINKGGKLETGAPSCYVDPLQYNLDTKILSFEITDKTNIGFGFDLLSGFFRALGFKIKLEKGKMQLAMHAYDNIQLNESVADVMGEGAMKGKEFRFTLNAGQLGADLGYFNRTPLSELSTKSLKSGLSNLIKKIESNSSGWHTQISFIDNKTLQIVIPEGALAGIKMGDEFALYNVKHYWSGQPCVSQFLMSAKTTREPIAIGKALAVETHGTLLQIEYTSDLEQLELGGRVEIKKAGALRYRMAIRDVESLPLVLPDGMNLDITGYAREQISALFNSYRFYTTSLGHN